jgi:hypothetical protein
MNTVLIRIDEDVFAKIGEKAREYGIPTAQPNVVLRKMFTLDTHIDISNIPLDVLNSPLVDYIQELSYRVVHALHYKNIDTIGDLVNSTRIQIYVIQNVGPQSMSLVDNFLAKRHLSFRE